MPPWYGGMRMVGDKMRGGSKKGCREGGGDNLECDLYSVFSVVLYRSLYLLYVKLFLDVRFCLAVLFDIVHI